MKRDFDLIRLLLIQIEGEEKVNLSEYTEDQIKYHKALLIEAGLADGNIRYSSRKNSEIPDKVYIKRLTWEGHEFLNKARNDSTWEKAKKHVINQSLSLSFDALKIALNYVIRNMLD